MTPEQIQQSYNAAMDSVNLINAGKPADMGDKEWADTLDRNKRHLQIMLARGTLVGMDLDPLIKAAA